MAVSKARNITGWVLGGLFALFMAFSAFGKIAGGPAVEGLIALGLGDLVLLIGIGELATAILFLIPVTLSAGAFLQSAYWGGAIVAHMTAGISYAFPAALLVAAWAITFIRQPEMFSSFLPKKA